MLLKTGAIQFLFLLAAFLSFTHITRLSVYSTDYSFLYAVADSTAPKVLSQEALNSSLDTHASPSGDKDGIPVEEEPNTNIDNRIDEDENETNERIAIVMRSMDPVQPIVMDRLVRIAEILQREEFQNYDMHLIVDQTRQNTTSTASMEEYLRQQDLSHLRGPKVFGVSEKMILDEFPALAKGYVPGPLIDGSKGTCCGKPLMWQLLIPTFVTFVHYHQEYDHTWVFEDDVWAIGMPLVEVLHIWDGRLRGQNASLVGTRLNYGNLPYSRMTKERHTESFRDILVKMKGTGWQHRNRTLLRMDNQKRSNVWNEWGENVLPPWSCMSDAVYRHSRDFGNYVYGMVKSNTYQFAECYQMPLAWYGGFKIADVKRILPDVVKDYKDGRREDEGVHLGWEELREKREYDEAEYTLEKLKKTTNISALVYHRLFVPPSGDEHRSRRNHTKTCSVSFDFENDVNDVGTCEHVLKNATVDATSWIFLGNLPMYKIFHNFRTIESPISLFNLKLDDKLSPNKIKNYYRYPPANDEEWQKKYGYESSSNRTEPAGKLGSGACSKCGQTKLQSRSLGRTLEYLLVESSRDVFFQTANTTTSQETVARWISENYDDRQNTVCVIQMDGYEMKSAPWRTTSDFLENTKKFHDLLSPSCGTIIRLGFPRFATSRDIREVVAWDDGARDLLLDNNASDGYFIDVSKVKKSESKNRYSKPIWRMFVKLMGLGPVILPYDAV